MAILHYSIGMPPNRSGGSVQYAYGLIQEQAKTENVLALICGDTLFRGRKAKIKKIVVKEKVPIYSLTNPLTPTLIYGTADPANQHREIKIDFDNITKFIKSNGITVLHLHTLMGIHLNVVKHIKSLGVKIIYTTHDFHGICLHYNLINQTGELCDRVDAAKCALCNLHEPSDRFLRIANSSIYHTMKNAGAFKFLKKPKVNTYLGDVNNQFLSNVSEYRIGEYKKLIEYYIDYFNLVDRFHFNSTQTEHVFKNFLPNIEGKVIPVITSGIKDRRKPLSLSKEIKFGFIGSVNDYKGFPILKRVLIELNEEGYCNFRLLTYSGNTFGTDPDCPFIEYQPPYNYSQISEIMYNLDCVIIPSKCYETFSLVALEALAHGRPVIVSDHVGAKDIVNRYNPEMVFTTAQSLKTLLKKVLDDPNIILNYGKIICSGNWNYSLENHTKEIIAYYNE